MDTATYLKRDELEALFAWMREHLVTTEGDRAGAPWEPQPWQRRVIRALFAKGVQTCATTLPRRQGKSSLVSAVATAALCCPILNRSPRSTVLVVGAVHAQALIIHRAVAAFVDAHEALRDTCVVHRNENRPLIRHKESGTTLRALAGGTGGRHVLGHTVSLGIVDEAGAHETDHVANAILASRGSVPMFRFWAVSTRPASPAHFFHRLLDPESPERAHAIQDYSVTDPKADVTDRKVWRKAAPSLDFLPSIRKAYEVASKAAAGSKRAEGQFRHWHLNSGQVLSVRTVLDLPEWTDNAERADLPPWNRDEGYVLGIDTGDALSATAAVGINAAGRVRVLLSYPEGDGIDHLERAKNVPGLLSRTMEQGSLHLVPGPVMRYEIFLEEVQERWGAPSAIVTDTFRSEWLREACRATGWEAKVETRRFGILHGGPDLDHARKAVLSGLLHVRPSLLVWHCALAAARIKSVHGVEVLDREGVGGQSIDAVAALVLACGKWMRERENPDIGFSVEML